MGISKYIFYFLISGSVITLFWNLLNQDIFYEKVNSVQRLTVHFTQKNESLTHFNLNKDTLVFLHIQKTGGSGFDRNIVKNLLVNKNNEWRRACFLKSVIENKNKTISKKTKFKNYSCPRNVNNATNWYFSRQTYGWVCGLHSDYSTLTECVKIFYNKKQKFNFYTILREPVRRYLSEWQHVFRGATWGRSKNYHCNK